MMRSALAALALVASTAFSCGNPAPAPPVPRAAVGLDVVKRAVDGDTVKLEDGRTIRVIGIDTPEAVDPRKSVQCGALDASQYAHETLDGQRVRVQGDPTQDAKDVYGRALAYLILPDGRNYSVMVAEAGWAHAYAYRKTKPPQAYMDVKVAESHAVEAKRGIWGQCGGKP